MIGRWPRVKVSELCDLIVDCVNKTAPNLDYVTPFKMIRTPNVKNGRINLEGCRYVEEATFEKWTRRAKLKRGDVLLTREAPMGEVGIINYDDPNTFLGQRLVQYRADSKKLDPHFLLYSFLSPDLQYQFRRYNNSGSIVSHIRVPDCFEFEINVPPVKEQKRIAKGLSELDEKIELNNRINAELESMAKLIYEYWFVQFDFPISADLAQAMGKLELEGKPYKSSGGKMVYNEELKREVPEGWEVKTLGDLGNFKNGVNYDPSKPGKIACPIINVRNISASSYFLKNEDLDVIYLKDSDVRKYSVHNGSIIIARSGIPGATRLISNFEKNTLYCGFAIHYELLDLNKKIPIFFYLKSLEQMISNGSGGTILKNVNQATLNELKISLPKNQSIITGFNNIINPKFKKINLIQKENQQLSSLRDWLLPMLMNGQVKVAELAENLSVAAEPEVNYGG